MNITEKVHQIRELRQRKNIATQAEIINTRPSKVDIEEIPSIFNKFKGVADPRNKENKRIFVFIVYFLYSPVSILNKTARRGAVRKKIAEVLGISPQAVTQYFGDSKFLFLNHEPFRKEVERIYPLIAS